MVNGGVNVVENGEREWKRDRIAASCVSSYRLPCGVKLALLRNIFVAHPGLGQSIGTEIDSQLDWLQLSCCPTRAIEQLLF